MKKMFDVGSIQTKVSIFTKRNWIWNLKSYLSWVFKYSQSLAKVWADVYVYVVFATKFKRMKMVSIVVKSVEHDFHKMALLIQSITDASKQMRLNNNAWEE